MDGEALFGTSTSRGCVWNGSARADKAQTYELQPHEGASETATSGPSYSQRSRFNPTRVRLEPRDVRTHLLHRGASTLPRRRL